MKNFSPIVALEIGPYFNHFCVKATRKNGAWETISVKQAKELAKAELAKHAAKRGFDLAPDGTSATIKEWK